MLKDVTQCIDVAQWAKSQSVWHENSVFVGSLQTFRAARRAGSDHLAKSAAPNIAKALLQANVSSITAWQNLQNLELGATRVPGVPAAHGTDELIGDVVRQLGADAIRDAHQLRWKRNQLQNKECKVPRKRILLSGFEALQVLLTTLFAE
jgi:hypothetical protein